MESIVKNLQEYVLGEKWDDSLPPYVALKLALDGDKQGFINKILESSPASLSGNWTHAAWEYPELYAAAGITMVNKDLPSQVLTKLLELTETAELMYGDRPDNTQGGNLAFRLFSKVCRGVFEHELDGKEDLATRAHHEVIDSLRAMPSGTLSPGFPEKWEDMPHVGLYDDSGFSQHNYAGTQMYWFGYGIRWMEEMLNYAKWTFGSKFDISSDIAHTCANAMYHGIRPLFYGGKGVFLLAGRQAWKQNHWSFDDWTYMKRAQEIQSFLLPNTFHMELVERSKEWIREGRSTDFGRCYTSTGVITRYSSRRDLYMLLRFGSSRISGAESLGQADENFHNGDANHLIYTYPGEYERVQGLMRWNEIPGSIVDITKSSPPKFEWNGYTEDSWVRMSPTSVVGQYRKELSDYRVYHETTILENGIDRKAIVLDGELGNFLAIVDYTLREDNFEVSVQQVKNGRKTYTVSRGRARITQETKEGSRVVKIHVAPTPEGIVSYSIRVE